MIAELVQWANDEFGGDGWSFRESELAGSTIRFIYGAGHGFRITVMITYWVVSWLVFDMTEEWSERTIDQGRILTDGGQP